jgi:hypothetical protein
MDTIKKWAWLAWVFLGVALSTIVYKLLANRAEAARQIARAKAAPAVAEADALRRKRESLPAVPESLAQEARLVGAITAARQKAAEAATGGKRLSANEVDDRLRALGF